MKQVLLSALVGAAAALVVSRKFAPIVGAVRASDITAVLAFEDYRQRRSPQPLPLPTEESAQFFSTDFK